jgi:thymidylate kinase
MLHNDNIINTLNYNVYLKWFDEFIKDYPITGYIYIKTTPEKAYERVLKRKRIEEEGVPLEYLKKCNDYHDNWLENENNVLIIDGNKDLNDDIIPDEWIQSIDTFIKTYIPNEELEFNKYFIDHHPFC